MRPFNEREKDRKAKLIIAMSDKTTEITDPESRSFLRTLKAIESGLNIVI